ncbi:MAG: hypothetical protein MHMPM18_004417 [Marteilia pararefringens]
MNCGASEFSSKKWTIETNQGPMASAKKLEALKFAESLKIPRYPDAIYSDALLRLTHRPSGNSYTFNALDALKLVSLDKSDLKVKASESWKNSNLNTYSSQPYDWTFFSKFSGSYNHEASSIQKVIYYPFSAFHCIEVLLPK